MSETTAALRLSATVDNIIKVASARSPDVTIGPASDPYLFRWWVLPRNPIFNIYLHRLMRSDDDRALHDHPWWNVSVIIKGGYDEMVPATWHPLGPTKILRRREGQIVFRFAKSAHRLIMREPETWSLFITGPRFRRWGFWCPNGWRDWEIFVDRSNGRNIVGRGCE